MQSLAALLPRHAFVDIETTGLDPAHDEIIEVGVVFVEDGKVSHRASWVMRPRGPLPAIITALTGLTEDDVADAPPFAAVAREIHAALEGWTLVAHNGSFEQSFLGEVVAGLPMIDSCALMHLLFPELKHHSLDSLVRWADVGRAAQHRAVHDADDTFSVVAHALARVVAEHRQRDAALLASWLPPSAQRDLLEVLGQLPGPPAPVLVEPWGVRASATALNATFTAWLASERPVALESESERLEADALSECLRASRQPGPRLTLAAPPSHLSGLRGAAGLPVVLAGGKTVCAARWRRLRPAIEAAAAALPARDGDALRSAAAYLSTWLNHTRTGDARELSYWFAERARGLRWLASAARCDGTDCELDCAHLSARSASASAPVLLVSHEDALDRLAAGTAGRLVVLDAGAFALEARRRGTHSLDERRVAAIAAGLDLVGSGTPQLLSLATTLRARAEELKTALLEGRTHLKGPIDTHSMHLPPWLRLRDAVSAVSHDLRLAIAALSHLEGPLPEAVLREARELAENVAQVLSPPAPGYELALPPGWKSPTLVSWARTATVTASLGPQLRAAAALLIGTARTAPPHPWLASLGLAEVALEPGAAVTGQHAEVLIVSEALPSAVVASRVTSLARLAPEPVLVLGRGLDAMARLYTEAATASAIPVRVAGSAAPVAPQLMLETWRGRNTQASGASVAVLAADASPAEVRAFLLGAGRTLSRVVVQVADRRAADALHAMLEGVQVRHATWTDVLWLFSGAQKHRREVAAHAP